jgi:predicted NBD/HSP70 family sugar kinase
VVTDLTKPLIDAGLVREVGSPLGAGGNPGVGRPRVNLALQSEPDSLVGVNIGVRLSQVGLTTLSGELLAEEDFETPPGHLAALALIRASIEQLRTRVPGRRLKMIGVSVPGPTDADRRTLLYAPHLGWRNVAIADSLRFFADSDSSAPSAPVPVVVENDATAAAMYEARLRLPEATDSTTNSFILVRAGTGIGVGLVLDGEVYRGMDRAEGLAGEFGHMTIVAGGKPCSCGNRGCWEVYASASAAASLYMGDRIQLGGLKAPRYLEIVARAEAGEVRAQRTLERVGEYLGIGIGNVISGLGVPRVIVSGRVVYGWKFINQSLRDAVGQSIAGKLTGWSIEQGEPRGAGLGGAFEIAVEEYLAKSVSW